MLRLPCLSLVLLLSFVCLRADDRAPLVLPVEDRYASHLEVARERIGKKDWAVAVTLLQKLLDLDSDILCGVRRAGPGGKESTDVVSLKAEANRLLAGLPAEGRAFYQQEYGPKGADLLKEARMFADTRTLIEVTRRYLCTDAGVEAAERLATHRLDRGQWYAAAVGFDELIDRAGIEKVAPLTLVKAALAYRRTADNERFEQVWKVLAAKLGKDQLKVSEKTLSLDDLRKEAGRVKPGKEEIERREWRRFRGYATRSSQGIGGIPFLDPFWKYEVATEQQTQRWLKQASEVLQHAKNPILSPSHPITLEFKGEDSKTSLVVYRSFWGIQARTLKDLPKDGIKAGDVYWEAPSQWSMDQMVREPRVVGNLNSWVQTYINDRVRPGVLFENTLMGALSTDGARLYAVEDIQLVPVLQLRMNRFGRPGPLGPGGRFGDAINHNRLQTYDLDSGKLMWEIGSANGKGGLDDVFFLSAPLPLHGRLYILNEKDNEVRLLALDPATGIVLAAMEEQSGVTLSPEQREKLFRLGQQEKPSQYEPAE